MASHTHTLVPSVPTIEEIRAESSTSIYVKWKPSNDAETYDVAYEKTSDSTSNKKQRFDVCSAILDGLAHATEYEVKVRARNAKGISDYSKAVKVKTKANGKLIDHEKFPN